MPKCRPRILYRTFCVSEKQVGELQKIRRKLMIPYSAAVRAAIDNFYRDHRLSIKESRNAR